jgi:DNA-binding transcriptional ArsR family regulator/uncharacterized protein YndB with AHSA1/START domain
VTYESPIVVDMDAIFKALSDETRRQLLDRLREQDGQTLTELEQALGMTRFGVMKHLKVLEAATLIVTRRSGRFKYHYLNAAPLQSVVDRWIEPLTQQPLARAALDLKRTLERTNMMVTKPQANVFQGKPDFVLQTFIRTTPEKLWEALTSAAISKHYNIHGAAIHSTFEVGSGYEYVTPDGKVILSGTILAADRLKRLEMTFVPSWGGPENTASRNVYEIEVVGDVTKLTILHYDLPVGQDGVKDVWSRIAASLKSLLETGKALSFA